MYAMHGFWELSFFLHIQSYLKKHVLRTTVSETFGYCGTLDDIVYDGRSSSIDAQRRVIFCTIYVKARIRRLGTGWWVQIAKKASTYNQAVYNNQ